MVKPSNLLPGAQVTVQLETGHWVDAVGRAGTATLKCKGWKYETNKPG
jgi:hypothetical protein